MTARTSVELHPDGCRIVVTDRSAAGAGRVEVRQYLGNLTGGTDTPAFVSTLRHLRRSRKLPHRATVVLWGLRSVHRLLHLPVADPAELEARAIQEAQTELSAIESGAEPPCIVVVPGHDVQVGPSLRREVSLLAVGAADVRRRIQAIEEAGFLVERVVTPGLALSALEQRDEVPETATVHIALESSATCLAIVREGVLLLSREIPWGHGHPVPEGRGSLADRLALEVRRSLLYLKQTSRVAIGSVALCGDLRSLRTLTAPLGVALGVPVRLLDTLAGIDATMLPEPARRLRADAAALRLVIAAGVEQRPEINVLPPALRQAREDRTLARLAAAALVAAVAVLAAYLYIWRSTRSDDAQADRIEQGPGTGTTSGGTVPATTPAAMPDADQAIPSPALPDVDPDRPPSGGRDPSVAVPPPVRTAASPPARPADTWQAPVVASILHSAERKRATVNGRIVGIGDAVDNAVVADILPNAVVFDSPAGRRIVSLRSPEGPVRAQ